MNVLVLLLSFLCHWQAKAILPPVESACQCQDSAACVRIVHDNDNIDRTATQQTWQCDCTLLLEKGYRFAGPMCQFPATDVCQSGIATAAHFGFCVNGGQCKVDSEGNTFCDCNNVSFTGTHCEVTKALVERNMQDDVPTATPVTLRPSISWSPTMTMRPTITWYPTTTMRPSRTWSPTSTPRPTPTKAPADIEELPTPASLEPTKTSVPTVMPSASFLPTGSAFPSESLDRLPPTGDHIAPSRPEPATTHLPTWAPGDDELPTPGNSIYDELPALSSGSVAGVVIAALVVVVVVYCFCCAGRRRRSARVRRRHELRSELELAETTQGYSEPMTRGHTGEAEAEMI